MDNINADEKYIMDVFLNLMNQIGYGKLFMFGKDENAHYFTYKEDNNWLLVEKSDWGVETSYYTNLYNLCLDLIKRIHDSKKRDLCLRVFNSNIIIPKDTEVLIFNRIRGCKLDEKNYLKGKIIGQKELEDRSTHGSPWYDKLYVVLSEDNTYYIGKYGNAIEGYFFKTVEDYITHIFDIMEENNNKINDLKKENRDYRNLLSDIVVKRNEGNRK